MPAPTKLSPRITVGVASLCTEREIARCLRALEGQSATGPMPDVEVVVAHNRPSEEIDRLRQMFPAVRFVAREGWSVPLQLMALAAEHARGEILMLTEDHCVPEPQWVARLDAALVAGRSAAGGPIDTWDGAPPSVWAFYFLDFFRYTTPVAEGITPALSICSVAYRRAHLEAIRDSWATGFHETEVHKRLRSHGPLWMEPKARVTTLRNVRFGGAMAECYGQGRLFASKRTELVSPARRLFYLALSPLLPPLLLFRRVQRGLSDREISRKFWPALPALIAMILAWSIGEAMGYLTKRPPNKLKLAPGAY